MKYFIITILWFAWHLNFQLTVSNFVFFIILFIGSFGIGYVAEKSKSLIFVSLFHAFFNISQIELFRDIQFYQKLIIISLSASYMIMVMINEKRKLNIT